MLSPWRNPEAATDDHMMMRFERMKMHARWHSEMLAGARCPDSAEFEDAASGHRTSRPKSGRTPDTDRSA
jgi:hypothetical protein